MERREELRDKILLLIPVALLFLQRLELILEICCGFLEVKGVKISISDLLSRDENRRGPTLGRMLAALKGTIDFAPDFKDHLRKFVEERNWLVHRLFVESAFHGAPDEKSLESIHTRLMFLLGDTQNFTDSFLGLYHKIARQLYERSARIEKDDTSLLDALAKYESLFDEKLNKGSI